MARPKASSSSKKQQKQRGVDFKKIKRKLGRKLPPPKNATNTEIKSKAIVLPQSVTAEKTGLAVSKKGLTLKELLQQTSHYNAKVRKDALLGIKDLCQRHPAELKLHKYVVIEKLRERINDNDKVVRETLYQLLKIVIFPACKEDYQGSLVSLMMANIFNAQLHLAFEVQLMAFKFLDLVVQYYPSSFSLYSEKILTNYVEIFRENHLISQDKGELKSTLAGLLRCLSLLPSNKRNLESCEKDSPGQGILQVFEPQLPAESSGFSVITKKLKDLLPVLINCFQELVQLVHGLKSLDAQSFDCMHYVLQSIDIVVQCCADGIGHCERVLLGEPELSIWNQTISSMLLKRFFSAFPLSGTHLLDEKSDDRFFILNTVIAEIFLRYYECICPPADLLDTSLAFIEDALLGKMCSDTRSGKAVWAKHILSLLSFIPKILQQVGSDWKYRLLQAFTKTFEDCSPESSLKSACLSAIGEMLVPGDEILCPDAGDPLFEHQIIWIRTLPLLLIVLDDKFPSSSQVVLDILLHLGQRACINASFASEYESIQYSLPKFFTSCQDEGNILSGPFVRLPRDSQELAICCLYYFSYLDQALLKSIASCCLCPELEPFVLFRIIDVLQSSFVVGHIQIADHLSFFITLLSRFKVFPENIYLEAKKDAEVSNRGTFKSLTKAVCFFLSQMGENSLVFRILEKVILDQLSSRLPLDNTCAMLRMLITLDSEPSSLSEQSIITLSGYLPKYLIDIVHSIPEEDDDTTTESPSMQTWYYYLMPCFFLFDRSHKVLKLVLNMMGSMVTESTALLPSSQNYAWQAVDCSHRINAIVSTIILMHKDARIMKIMSLFKMEMVHIYHTILSFQSSEEANMNIEEKHRIECASSRLKIILGVLPKELPAS